MSKITASRIYVTVSVIFFNVFLLLALINLGFSGLADLKEYLRKSRLPPGLSFSFKADNPELSKVYRGLSKPELNELIKENRSVTQGYAPYVQFKELPFHGMYVNVDPRGFRLIDGREKWPINKNCFNIFVFGGSTAFGAGVADDQTIAGCLKQIIGDDGDPTINVYNFGRSSYISIQEGVLLQQLILSGNVPKLAIFVDGLNDFAHYNGLPGFTKDLTKFMDEGHKPTWRKIIEELPATKFFTKSREAISEKANPPAQVIPEVISRYKANKDIIEGICDKFGIKTVFVWQPVPVYKYDQSYNIFNKFDYSSFLPYLKLGYEAMARDYHAGELGNNFIWLADMQENLDKPLYVDAVHYSAEMNKLIAERISSVLSEKKILP